MTFHSRYPSSLACLRSRRTSSTSSVRTSASSTARTPAWCSRCWSRTSTTSSSRTSSRHCRSNTSDLYCSKFLRRCSNLKWVECWRIFIYVCFERLNVAPHFKSYIICKYTIIFLGIPAKRSIGIGVTLGNRQSASSVSKSVIIILHKLPLLLVLSKSRCAIFIDTLYP